MANRSVVEYFGKHEGYSCGYCKSKDKSHSHGMWGHRVTTQDYQDLINRGWRRSGKYCYKPIMNVTCCPQYAIRCEALKFKLSKSQKKILKRMKNFLLHGQTKNDSVEEQGSSGCNETDGAPMDYAHIPEINLDQRMTAKRDVDSFLEQNQEGSRCEEIPIEGKDKALKTEPSDIESTTSNPSMSSDTVVEKGSSHKKKILRKGPDPNRPPCRKAKDIRRERHLQKLLKSGVSAKEIPQRQQKCSVKTVEDFVSDATVGNPLHRLELRLIPCNLNNPQFSQSFEQSYELYQKYQMSIHEDPPDKCSKSQFTRFLVNNPFQLRLLKVNPGNASFMHSLPQSYELYKKYQMTIHNEKEVECDQSTYEGFLVHTPLKFSEESSNSQALYGSFHQQYWLDNKLIAVGVIDVLPHCVSSVYLYYDPDYSFLSLGTYAALREIVFTRELHKNHPDLQYYYMGFYIHSCPKMKYKGSYSPSFLVCPETYLFKPMEMCVPKLDILKYSRLEENAEKEDTDGIVQLREVMILHQRQAMNYVAYASLNRHADDEEQDVREYAALVGRKCYKRILLYRS